MIEELQAAGYKIWFSIRRERWCWCREWADDEFGTFSHGANLFLDDTLRAALKHMRAYPTA